MERQEILIHRFKNIKLCVGGIVVLNNKVLFVRQTYGNLKNKWTIPWGYAFNPEVKEVENPDEAVVREIREESGIESEVIGLIGVQNYVEGKERQLHFLYLCEYIEGELKPDFKETDDAKFFSLEELEGIYEECDRYCFWIVRRVLENSYHILKLSRENPATDRVGFY